MVVAVRLREGSVGRPVKMGIKDDAKSNGKARLIKSSDPVAVCRQNPPPGGIFPLE